MLATRLEPLDPSPPSPSNCHHFVYAASPANTSTKCSQNLSLSCCEQKHVVCIGYQEGGVHLVQTQDLFGLEQRFTCMHTASHSPRVPSFLHQFSTHCLASVFRRTAPSGCPGQTSSSTLSRSSLQHPQQTCFAHTPTISLMRHPPIPNRTLHFDPSSHPCGCLPSHPIRRSGGGGGGFTFIRLLNIFFLQSC
jgi:hypothetical protein